MEPIHGELGFVRKEKRDKVQKHPLFENRNAEFEGVLDQQAIALKSILKESRRQSGPYASFFKQGAERLLDVLKFKAHFEDDKRSEMSLESLAHENHAIFEELFDKQYGTSLANPVVCVDLFGQRTGQFLAFVYKKSRDCYTYVFQGKYFRVSGVMDLFIKTYEALKTHDLESLRATIKAFAKDDIQYGSETYAVETYGGKNRRLTRIVKEADLSTPRYLYDLGIYVSEHELRTHAFMRDYPESQIEELAQVIVNAYIEGFRRDGKDISLRHRVRVIAVAGQERLTRRILQVLDQNNLDGFIEQFESTAVNKQYGYDHKFDMALYLDEAMLDYYKKSRERLCEQERAVLEDYSGILYIEKFGEKPFSPVSNTARIVLKDEQQALYQEMMRSARILVEKYIPESERSFCIVAFPSPEIGPDFEAIFEDTARINLLSSEAYEPIQKRLTDALDLGTQVHVVGKDTNRTDIKVALNKLDNLEKQTNFVNCVADVNIPLGEVFTSPVLKGTNGLLHLEKVYLDGFSYVDLELVFEEGYVTHYNCKNFDDEAENKKYIKENLLFPHDTLPLGEFAIGTNTLAYVIAEKYQIVDKLPILIVEKMGPHFAIGDTCFSFAEDMQVYNAIDGKEIMAKDNEKSLMRKEDISKAYTNRHTDITLPYDGIEKIAVIQEDGSEIDIIKKGRFVLEGTEALNEPLDA